MRKAGETGYSLEQGLRASRTRVCCLPCPYDPEGSAAASRTSTPEKTELSPPTTWITGDYA